MFAHVCLRVRVCIVIVSVSQRIYSKHSPSLPTLTTSHHPQLFLFSKQPHHNRRLLLSPAMADQRDIDIRFTRAFNSAKALHDDDLLDECVANARELLEDPAIPHYHPMKTLLLLGSALEVLNEAFHCWEESDALWKLIRSWHPEGQNSDVDKVMAEVRTSFD